MLRLTQAVALASVFLSTFVEGRAIEGNEFTRDIPRTWASKSPLSKRSNVTAVYLDPATHSLVFTLPPGHSKRDSEEDNIRSLLHSHNSHDFCKAYCDADYYQQPATVYQTTTKSTTVLKSTTTTLKPITTTKTVSGSHSAASTLTLTSTIVVLETSTINATPSTVDIEATSVVSLLETLTTYAPTQVLTQTVVQVTTEIDTITGGATTITEAIPVPTIQPRDGKPSPPSWLSGHSGSKIKGACEKEYPPSRQTVTCTVVKYVSINENRVFTVGGHTVTTTLSIVQPASTTTVLDPITIKSSVVVTSTPVTTITETTLTTQVITVLETLTPSATAFLTVLTTTTSTTTAPGSIATACQGQVTGLSGGGITDNLNGATLDNAAGSTAPQCCNSCYNKAGCSGWLFFAGYGCFIGVENTGTSGQVDSTCPGGTGSFALFTGGAIGDVGGPGPCITTLNVSS